MSKMLPEAKDYRKGSGKTNKFNCIKLETETNVLNADELRQLLEMKFRSLRKQLPNFETESRT